MDKTLHVMQTLILILAIVVAYPVFMFASYLFSKVIFKEDDELSEFSAKRNAEMTGKQKSLSHI